MARELFGTDGVRGAVGELLTAELALGLARAATSRCSPRERPRVLVIRDTRESGPMLEAAVAAGVAAAGGEALLGGVLPTPAAPLLLSRYGLDLAAVISASHNPFADNGIKFFGADGDKLSDEPGARRSSGRSTRPGCAPPSIRAACASCTARSTTTCARCTSASPASTSPASTSCSTAPTGRPTAPPRRSSGASAPASPSIADAPDGRNINAGCGSTHVDRLAEAVRGGRPRPRLRVRRRRRPRARRRPQRHGGRRRRADRAGRAAPARGRAVCPATASR